MVDSIKEGEGKVIINMVYVVNFLEENKKEYLGDHLVKDLYADQFEEPILHGDRKGKAIIPNYSLLPSWKT